MKRNFAVAFVLALAMSGVLLAASAHWVFGPSASVEGSTLTISGKAAGLGNTVESTDFSLTGTVTLFSRCYNRGGNKPQADNKQETIDVNEEITADVRNGQTTLLFSIGPLSTLSCPGNQVVVVESFSYDLWLRNADFPVLDTHLVG